MLTSKTLALCLQRFRNANAGGITNKDQRDVGGIIAGYLIGMNAQLPTSPVTEPTNHWVVTQESAAKTIMGQANEEVIINTIIAVEVARNVYLYRYNMVHCPETMMANSLNLLNTNSVALPAGVKGMVERITPEVLASAAKLCF